MTKEELIEKLRNLPSGDEERDHIYADNYLLDYINDEKITQAFDDIPKWYA